MAKAGGFNISGEKELLRMLREFAPKEAKAAVRMATRDTAKFVLADMKTMVAHDTGLLEESLVVRAIRRTRRGLGHRVVTKENFGDAFYGHFLEFGTVKMPADPFMRPALWGNQEEMKRQFVKHLNAAIAKLKHKASLQKVT